MHRVTRDTASASINLSPLELTVSFRNARTHRRVRPRNNSTGALEMTEKQRERAATQERDRARQVEAAGARARAPRRRTDRGRRPRGRPASPVSQSAQRQQNPWRSVALGVALLAGVAGAAFFGMGAAQDSLTQQEVQQRQADYQASMAAGPIVVDRVSDDEVDDALATMGLDTEQKQELREKGYSGPSRSSPGSQSGTLTPRTVTSSGWRARGLHPSRCSHAMRRQPSLSRCPRAAWST